MQYSGATVSECAGTLGLGEAIGPKKPFTWAGWRLHGWMEELHQNVAPRTTARVARERGERER